MVWAKKNKKIFLESYYSGLLQNYEFDDVTWAICSQEHLFSKNVDVRRNFFFFLASHMRDLNGKGYRKTSRTKFVGYLEVIRAGNFFLKIFVNHVARGLQTLKKSEKHVFSRLWRPLATKPLRITLKWTGPFSKYSPSSMKLHKNIRSNSYHYVGVAPQISSHECSTWT